MKLVVDSNVLVSALLRESITRKILFHPHFYFFAPKYIFDEIREHEEELLKKSGLTRHRFDLVLKHLATNITIVDKDEFEGHIRESRRIMEDIDIDDAPFIALALSFDNDGIWSNDGHYQKQKVVRIWKTGHLLEELRRFEEVIHR